MAKVFTKEVSLLSTHVAAGAHLSEYRRSKHVIFQSEWDRNCFDMFFIEFQEVFLTVFRFWFSRYFLFGLQLDLGSL